MELLRKYNTGTTIYFPLIGSGTADFITTAAHASGDTQIIKDGGAAANTTNAFAHEGNGIYSLALTSTEMQAAKIQVTVIDQGTKAYSDQAIILATYGNASAEIVFDLSTATQSVNVSQISGDSTAADNAEAFFDGTGYAGTNNVIPTVTTLTNLPAITAGWLTATGIAADAFTAAKFAADVTTELQSGLATAAALTTVSGKIDTIDDFLDTEIAAILADTNELQTDWANGGRLDLILDARASQASVDTIDGIVDSILVDTAEIGAAGAGLTALASAANLATLTAYVDTEVAAILADTNELQTDWANGGRLDLILDARASQASVDTIDGIVDSILVDTAEIGAAGAGLSAIPWNAAWDAEVQSEVADALTAFWTSPATLVDLIWDEPTAGHAGAGTTGKALTDAGSAGDPWTTALPGAYGAGTAGFILGTNLDAAVTTRMASYTQPTGFLAATFPGTVASTTNITAGTITTATNVTTVNGLAANVITAAATAADFTTEIQTGLATAAALAVVDGIVDDILVDTAEIGVAGAGLTNINLPNQTMDIVGNITGNLSGSVGSVTTVNDKTGYRLSATGVDDILDEVVEGSFTLRQYARLWSSALLAKLSGGATTTNTFRDTADSKDRITATVDADGNRTSVTLDGS